MLTVYEPGTAPSFFTIVVSWNEPSGLISPQASAPSVVFGWNLMIPPETGWPLANSTLPFTGYTWGGGVVLYLGPQPAKNTAPMTPRNARRCHMCTERRFNNRTRSP